MPISLLEVNNQLYVIKYVKIWITEGKVHKARQQNIALSLRKLFFTRDQCAHNIRTHKVSSKPSFGTTTRTAVQGPKIVLKYGKFHHFLRNLILFEDFWNWQEKSENYKELAKGLFLEECITSGKGDCFIDFLQVIESDF